MPHGDIVSYQGGIPFLYTRAGARGQRGSGFFSALKRFLIPIGKAVLPSVFSGVSDVLAGKSVGETLKRRGLEVGKKALGATVRQVVDTMSNGNKEMEEAGRSAAAELSTPPPAKKYKKTAHTGRRSILSHRQQQQQHSWQ